MNKFDRINDRVGTSSLKWDMLEAIYGDKDLVSMWVADSDFKVPEAVTEAIIKRAEHGIFGYTVRPQAFYDSIIQWVDRRHKWKIRKDWLLYTPGIVAGINWAVHCFTEPGDKIIIQPPVYYPFATAVKQNGRKLVENILRYDGERYVMDFADLEKQIDEKTKMLILCSPHNPISRVWSEAELTRLAEICVKHDILIVSDEIHSDLIMEGHRHIPIAKLSKEVEDRTITFMAPSKTFNVAGLETSVAIISNPTLMEKMAAFQQSIGAGMSNIFGIEAFINCYTQGEPWLEEQLGYLQSNVEYFMNYISTNMPEVKVVKPEGTYLLWVDCRALGYNSDELGAFFKNDVKVALDNGSMFGESGAGYVRFNLATPKANVVKTVENFKAAYETRMKELK